MKGVDIIKCVLVKGSRATCLAIRTTTLSCETMLFDGSALDRHRSRIVAGLVWMAIESYCHDTTFGFPGELF